MLKHRVLTATVLIPLVVGMLFFTPPLVLNAGIMLVMALASWEWSTMAGIKTFHNKVILLLLTIGVLWLALQGIFLTLLFSMVLWLVALAAMGAYPYGKERWANSKIFLSVLSLFVLVPFAVSMMILNPWQIMYLLVLVWGADIGAYFAGSKWGVHRIAPKLSPKKSYQGLAGGMLMALLVGVIFAWFVDQPQILASLELGYMVCSFIVTVVMFALFGDLFESMIKRAVGVKDSGTLLPGHGGILDRIDSLTAAAPWFALVSIMVNFR